MGHKIVAMTKMTIENKRCSESISSSARKNTSHSLKKQQAIIK